jgi:hypothetical protein
MKVFKLDVPGADTIARTIRRTFMNRVYCAIAAFAFLALAAVAHAADNRCG